MNTTLVVRVLLAALTVGILLSLGSGIARADNNCLYLGAITYDDGDSAIHYANSWYPYPYTKTCNSSLHYTNVVGASASLNFTGSRITLLYSMAWNRGSTNVTINGYVNETFSSYTTGLTRRQVAKTWVLPYGSYTIYITNVSSDSTVIIDLDALIVDIGYSGSSIVDDNTQSAFNYIGTGWSHYYSSGYPPYNNTSSYSPSIDANVPDSVTFTFLGDQLTWVFAKASNRAIAAIKIDGKDPQPPNTPTVDLYSAGTQWQQSITYSYLGSGVHTIHISLSGQPNACSGSCFINVDAFVVASQSYLCGTPSANHCYGVAKWSCYTPGTRTDISIQQSYTHDG